jgi:hypothetical protein
MCPERTVPKWRARRDSKCPYNLFIQLKLSLKVQPRDESRGRVEHELHTMMDWERVYRNQMVRSGRANPVPQVLPFFHFRSRKIASGGRRTTSMAVVALSPHFSHGECEPSRLVCTPAASRSATAIGSRTATSAKVSSGTGRSRSVADVPKSSARYRTDRAAKPCRFLDGSVDLGDAPIEIGEGPVLDREANLGIGSCRRAPAP